MTATLTSFWFTVASIKRVAFSENQGAANMTKCMCSSPLERCSDEGNRQRERQVSTPYGSRGPLHRESHPLPRVVLTSLASHPYERLCRLSSFNFQRAL